MRFAMGSCSWVSSCLRRAAWLDSGSGWGSWGGRKVVGVGEGDLEADMQTDKWQRGNSGTLSASARTAEWED